MDRLALVVGLDLGGMSRLEPVVGWVALDCRSESGRYEQVEVRTKIAVLVGATEAEIADPAVVLVMGWVALECRSESGRHEHVSGKSRCAPKSPCLLGQPWQKLLILPWC